jgi:hypothetical protein
LIPEIIRKFNSESKAVSDFHTSKIRFNESLKSLLIFRSLTLSTVSRNLNIHHSAALNRAKQCSQGKKLYSHFRDSTSASESESISLWTSIVSF